MDTGQYTAPVLNHAPNPQRYYFATWADSGGVRHAQDRNRKRLTATVKAGALRGLKSRVAFLEECRDDWRERFPGTAWPHADIMTTAILRLIRGPVCV